MRFTNQDRLVIPQGQINWTLPKSNPKNDSAIVIFHKSFEFGIASAYFHLELFVESVEVVLRQFLSMLA